MEDFNTQIQLLQIFQRDVQPKVEFLLKEKTALAEKVKTLEINVKNHENLMKVLGDALKLKSAKVSEFVARIEALEVKSVTPPAKSRAERLNPLEILKKLFRK